MASTTLKPSPLELWEHSAIFMPEPLRIVKECYKTSAGEDNGLEQSTLGYISAVLPKASTSPRTFHYKNLTILNKTRPKGSILDGSLCSDGSLAVSTEEPGM